MPPSNIRKNRRQRKGRGRTYLVWTIVLILIISVGWYVYASSLAVNSNPTVEVVYARLNTSQGVIDVELYQSKTPKTVTNFITLANSGFYNNLVWHRIVSNPAVIQTGDPNTRNGGGVRGTWGSGGSSQTVPLEIDSSLRNNIGYLAMARKSGDLNSGTSQFYINLADNNYLDGEYTVFGKVISGMNVAFAIGNLPVDSPSNGQPLDPLPYLISVTISNSP